MAVRRAPGLGLIHVAVELGDLGWAGQNTAEVGERNPAGLWGTWGSSLALVQTKEDGHEKEHI